MLLRKRYVIFEYKNKFDNMNICGYLERIWHRGMLKLPWELTQHQDLVQESELPRNHKTTYAA